MTRPPVRRARRTAGPQTLDEVFLAARPGKAAPHEFVLDAISSLAPTTRPMFGCLAVYVEDKIVLILRDKPSERADNGVWIATTREHHDSLRRELPPMRSIGVLGGDVTAWQVIPADAPEFEEAALRACKLILEGDPRIGKVPKRRSARRTPEKKTKARSGKASNP
jgi:hypothetical protein